MRGFTVDFGVEVKISEHRYTYFTQDIHQKFYEIFSLP